MNILNYFHEIAHVPIETHLLPPSSRALHYSLNHSALLSRCLFDHQVSIVVQFCRYFCVVLRKNVFGLLELISSNPCNDWGSLLALYCCTKFLTRISDIRLNYISNVKCFRYISIPYFEHWPSPKCNLNRQLSMPLRYPSTGRRRSPIDPTFIADAF